MCRQEVLADLQGLIILVFSLCHMCCGLHADDLFQKPGCTNTICVANLFNLFFFSLVDFIFIIFKKLFLIYLKEKACRSRGKAQGEKQTTH